MTFEVWTMYLGTVLLFMSTPGPSHLLMLSTSISNGFRRSLATAAGDLTANVLQMLLAGLGLAAILTASRYGFAIVKWAGVAYLLWLGIRQIGASFKRHIEAKDIPKKTLTRLWLTGFVTSAANPKAVVFFASLFPQFINPEYDVVPQIAILGVTYIIVDGLFLSGYGKGASWLAHKIRGQARAWLDRTAGAGLVGAAILLGLKTSQRS